MSIETAPYDTAVARGPRNRPLIWVAVVAFLLGLVAMAALAHRFGDRIGWKAPASPEAQRIAVAPLPQPTSAPVASPQDLATLSARETAIAARIAELEGRLASLDVDSRVASGFATRAEGLMVAFAARRALDRGLALGYIEDQLRRRFGAAEPAAVNTVIAAARQPVTLEDLRLAMDTIAPQLTAGDPDESWWAGIRRELSQLIVIRQDASPSMLPEDRLARARRRLDAGQVEGALAEVARMPGAASAQNWMEAARRFIETRSALNAIETVAIQGGGGLPSATPVVLQVPVAPAPSVETPAEAPAQPIENSPARAGSEG